MESVSRDVLYFSEIHWFGCSQMLKCKCDLEIRTGGKALFFSLDVQLCVLH
jgi:hypothetical protein